MNATQCLHSPYSAIFLLELVCHFSASRLPMWFFFYCENLLVTELAIGEFFSHTFCVCGTSVALFPWRPLRGCRGRGDPWLPHTGASVFICHGKTMVCCITSCRPAVATRTTKSTQRGPRLTGLWNWNQLIAVVPQTAPSFNQPSSPSSLLSPHVLVVTIQPTHLWTSAIFSDEFPLHLTSEELAVI